MDRRLLALALGMFALGTDSFVVAGVLPRIAHEFGIGIGAAGQMTTVYSLSYALLAPLIATLAAGVARKRLILIGLAIFVIANLGTALAPSFGFALATRALAGLGASIFSPTATGSAAAIVPPERRGMALAVVLTGMTVSTAIGAPIGTLIGSFVSWHWTMVFVAALAALSGLGVLVPMQHRIVGVEPALAPILMGLNNSATFLGATAAGAIGAAGIHLVGSHALGFVGAALVGAAMIVSAMADRRIAAVARAGRAGGELPVVAASRAGQA